ncbi:hypothetical protein G9A89_009839 [Geosiphon pyriformis]|nr:hypothetical protein G9A89_009839 [Geosiphon pyriformis]
MGDIGKDKNWPVIYPLIYHNIEVDINEARARLLAKRSYNLWRIFYITLGVNVFAVCVLAVNHFGGTRIEAIFISLLYLLFFPIFDFAGRHYSLYRGLRDDNISQLRWFFLNQALVIVFGFFIGIGFFEGGGGGLIAMIYCFSKNKIFAGIVSAICSALVVLQIIYNIKLFFNVKSYIEDRGWTIFPNSTTTKTG